MSLSGSGSTFLPYTINGLSDASFSNSNIGNGVATTLQITSATPNKIARFDANQYLVSATFDVSDFVPYSGATGNVSLGSNTLTANKLVAPTAEIDTVKVMSAGDDYSLAVNANNLEIKNLTTNLKVYTDGESLWAPGRLTAGETVYTVDTQLTGSQYFRYGTATQFSEGVNINDNYQISDDTGSAVLELSKTTGATVSKLNITSVPSATPALALGVNGSGGVVSFAVPVATNLLPLNNQWTGSNTYNNNVAMGAGYTTNVNDAFASLQTRVATATGFATGATDYPSTAPASVLTNPSYYQLAPVSGTTFGMNMLFNRGYTGASFTAGANTTITGSAPWTANSVSSRIAIITFDVSAYIGKSLRCVWEGVNSPYFLVSPYPYFTVVNGSTTVFSSPQPIVGTNTFAWNFTPTVGTTTITITLQASGTPSIPALVWSNFSIKQVGAFSYQAGATYKLTLTNIRGSASLTYDIYQYNTAGTLKTYIGGVVGTHITTTGQNVSLFFYPNLVPTYTGVITYEFQAGSAGQYVRFDSATMIRADMAVYGTVQTALTTNNQIISANPSGNSGNGVVMNMSAINGAFGSLEVYQTNNVDSTSKLPLALQAYGGNVGIGLTNPTQKLQVAGRGSFGYIPSSKRGIIIDNEDAYGTNPCIQGVSSAFGASPITINPVGGYVAIGKVIPSQALDVSGDGARIQVESNTASNAVLQIKTNANYSYIFTDQSGNLQMYPGTITKGLYFQGVGNINGGSGFAPQQGYMQTGSLTIGDITKNYGGGGSNWNSNTAGFMMECLDSTEIAVHDAGAQVASFMYYSGNVFTIGRSMGFAGTTPVNFASKVVITGQNGREIRLGETSYGAAYWKNPNDSNTHWGYPSGGGSDNYIRGTQTYIDTPILFNNSSINFNSINGDFGTGYYMRPYCYDPANGFMRVGQTTIRSIITNNSLAWSYGTNAAYAFYMYSGRFVCQIQGYLSFYVSSPGFQYFYLRITHVDTGAAWQYNFVVYVNATYQHMTFPYFLNFTSGAGYNGWYNTYMASNGGSIITDSGDQFQQYALILPTWNY
jgi:hypothetical protein